MAVRKNSSILAYAACILPYIILYNTDYEYITRNICSLSYLIITIVFVRRLIKEKAVIRTTIDCCFLCLSFNMILTDAKYKYMISLYLVFRLFFAAIDVYYKRKNINFSSVHSGKMPFGENIVKYIVTPILLWSMFIILVESFILIENRDFANFAVDFICHLMLIAFVVIINYSGNYPNYKILVLIPLGIYYPLTLFGGIRTVTVYYNNYWENQGLKFAAFQILGELILSFALLLLLGIIFRKKTEKTAGIIALFSFIFKTITYFISRQTDPLYMNQSPESIKLTVLVILPDLLIGLTLLICPVLSRPIRSQRIAAKPPEQEASNEIVEEIE